METSLIEVTNMKTTRAISRSLNHQGISAFIKLSKAQDKLKFMPKPIRLGISLTIAKKIITSYELT